MNAEESYQRPEHGWTCFYCGETFMTVGAASDHFGARPESVPGCLIDRILPEEGGKPERGRGLLMALRNAEERIEKLQRTNDELDNEIANATTHHSNTLRRWGELIQPGRTIEQMIELFHATTPSHGGFVRHCLSWPCHWLSINARPHTFTAPDKGQIDKGADPLICIICGYQLAELSMHGNLV